MVVAILVLLMMPVVFALMSAMIRINMKNDERSKEEEKKAKSIFVNVELAALVMLIAGIYLKSMLAGSWALTWIVALIAVMFMFNRKMNEPEAEVIINNGGDTA
jgi:hypothetical protein